MKRLLLLSLCTMLLFCGCEQKKEEPVAEKQPAKPQVEYQIPTAKILFNEPAAAESFELPSEALQVWRRTTALKPALVLFSIHPFLDPLNDQQKPAISELIQNGSADDFRNQGSYFRLQPALTPTQALSAAIANGLFSEIIWVFPTRSNIAELSLEAFRKQVVEARFLSEAEGATLKLEEGVISGTLRNLPFRAVHPDAIPDLEKPAVVHIDTGYFKGLFKNEVATPLYDLLHQTIMRISQSEWQTYATTLSYSTREMMFSLDVRFLLTNLKKIIADPQLLQNKPEAWRLHGEAMYLGNMYMESKSMELIEAAFAADASDPITVYALSQIRFQQGRADEAFSLLDQAVKLDPGYATAYVMFAETGRDKGDLEKALELQNKAIAAWPENPFLRVHLAELLINAGQNDKALKIIGEIQRLSWSPLFHPNMPDNLKKMADYARNPQAADKESK